MLEELFELSRRFIENYKRDYQRSFLKKYPLENRFSIIVGPRGVGKTTAMIQYLLKFTGQDVHSREAIYVQADHFLVGNHSLYEIADSFAMEGGKLIRFDEIHKYPEWSRDLKSIYDTFPGLKIIASGSSAMEIRSGSHDLSRRAIVYHMNGMSFREFLEIELGLELESPTLENLLKNHRTIGHHIVKKIEDKKSKILPLYKKYLEYGCYPYFREFENKDLFYITLEQSVHTTVENDLISVFPGLNGVGVKKIKKLLAFIAESVPFVPDLKKMKRILEIGDERTLKNYLKYLEDGGIILTVSKKGKSLRQLEKPEKIFLNNTNLMYAVGSRENLRLGNIRENFFVHALGGLHRVSVSDRGDFEVDDKFTFEVGGKRKSFNQIKDMENSFLALDEIEYSIGNKVPLWLFGFLY